MELVLGDRANALPMSRLPKPETLRQIVAYTFWAWFFYVFRSSRNVLVKLRIIRHDFRQAFLLGTLAEGKSIKALLSHLGRQHFGNHFIAWIDKEELIGLRRLDGFVRQYHLRIFKDGEVRGHYEYTPEAHPFLHLKEVGMEARRREFMEFLRGWIVPVPR